MFSAAPLSPERAAALACLCLLAGYFDVRFRVVPNALVACGAAAGLVLWAAEKGAAGLAAWGVGLLAGVGMLLPLFAAGHAGGGDCKFLGAVGALGGAAFALQALAIGAALGAFGGALALARAGRLRGTAARTAGLLAGFSPASLGAGVSIPYAAWLAAGVIAAVLLHLRFPWGWWR